VIEEVAGAVKDLIKAGTVRHFGMSEPAALGPFGFSAAAHARKVVDHGNRRSAAGHLTSRSRPGV
jgi:aryl-alcohol dehydrogenase-like predicted oxidoreductase